MSWDDFLGWGQRLAADIDLAGTENGYKVEAAKRLLGVRDLVIANDPNWPEEFRKAVASSNLLDQRFFFPALTDDLRQHPEDLRSIVLNLWSTDPDPRRLDAFAASLRPFGRLYTVGNATALGALLLMARDPSAYPPYRATPATQWLTATDSPLPPDDSATARYEALLAFCDELVRRANDVGLLIRNRLEAQGLAWAVTQHNPPPTWELAEQKALKVWRGDKETDETMAADQEAVSEAIDRGTGPSSVIERAAWLILGPCLRGEGSPLDESVVTWTPDAAADLRSRIESDDASAKGFLTKLERQLAGAPRAVVLLAAELLYLQVLPLSNLTVERKGKRIERVLSILDPAPGLPAGLVEGLEAPGVFNGGVGFNVQIWHHLVWLTRYVSHWTGLSDADRAAALADPWTFRSAMPPGAGMPSIRYSLRYLAWPGTFEPIVKANHRRAIRDAFADRIGGPSGADGESIDRDLYAIRKALDSQAGHRVSFYHPPYLDIWQKDKDEGQRAWLVRPNPGGATLVQRWKVDGFVSLVAQYLGELKPGLSIADVRAAVENGYQHVDYAQRLSLANEYHSFLTKMKPDDLVATVVDDALHVGVISGDPTYTGDSAARLQRAVTWSTSGVAREKVPAPVPALLDAQGVVVDLTAGLKVLERFIDADPIDDSDDESDDKDDPPPLLPDVVPTLLDVTDEVARSLHMPKADLQELVDLLQSRQQIVLYGPPGTGKTYVAKKLAEHLVGTDDTSRARLVQFHPSYAYEDFFEGYRPALAESGSPTFSLQAGPLRELAGEASKEENRGQPFVLIVDEMNRANLAKVFGELYFLLEYRNESIRLQYRPTEAFRLPKNLFIIGTMNTADRSIAMVDAAIRRRFAFVELHPDEQPVRDVLKTFVRDNHKTDDRVALLRALNAAIGDSDRDMKIGPSYLMKPDVDIDGGLQRVWKYDLLPLLEEHYYGRLTRQEVHERFGLTALLAQMAPATIPVGTEVAEPVDSAPDEASQTPAPDPAVADLRAERTDQAPGA